ncbi:protein FAF-like, chloroplastic [Canna indica]|uniref:Protein FAF-like, chloroplastic n=1 Tax=Canna indica TaxID=4628 RepID=A0AAQ3KHE7_9LILI|nr:protein FAF-like, chloroplastic [Canna indica]
MLSSFIFGKKSDFAAPVNAMQTPVPPLTAKYLLGLKTIADSTFDSPQKSNCVKRTFVASPSPSSAEDCFGQKKDDVRVLDDDPEYDDDNACWATYGRRSSQCRRKFPPPIPLLARTGNLAGHMPWVLQRIYREDGRLEIREVRVKHHEYFRARRIGGRLILQLVELDSSSLPEKNTEKISESGDFESVLDLARRPARLQVSLPEKMKVSSLPDRQWCEGERRLILSSA